MRRPTLTLLSLLPVLLLLAGCGGAPVAGLGGLPTATPPPTEPIPEPTATFLPAPTVTPFPTATPGGAVASTGLIGAGGGDVTPAIERPLGELVFSSGFEAGWPTVSEGGVQVSLEDGGYVFALAADAMTVQNSSAVDAANLYAQVEVTPQACPPGGGYGMFFRMRDEGNYYALTFFCDGRVTVFARSGSMLVPDPILDVTLPAGLSASSAGVHTIGVLANGSRIEVFFDGQSIAVATDTRHTRGDVAVYAVSPRSSDLRVVFDNLGVWAAQ